METAQPHAGPEVAEAPSWGMSQRRARDEDEDTLMQPRHKHNRTTTSATLSASSDIDVEAMTRFAMGDARSEDELLH